MKKIILSIFLILITGCAGVGVIKTNNPQKKLEQADYLLYEHNRPLLAERLIFEAITDYRKTNNQFGLANALRDYGDLLRSSAVAHAGVQFLHVRFLDPEVTMQNRLDKAKYYFTQSIEHYKLASVEASQNNQLRKLMNIYFNIASLHARVDNTVEACLFFSKTLNTYNDAIHQNPDIKIPSPLKGQGSGEDYIKSIQALLGCKP